MSDPDSWNAVLSLLAANDPASVRQGLELARALDDPALWAHLVEGVTIRGQDDDRADELVFPDGCTLRRLVSDRYEDEIAWWALRALGRLDHARRLVVWSHSLPDFRVFAGLVHLEELRVTHSRALASVDGASGLPALEVLILVACDSLTSLAGLAGCTRLKTLDLSACHQLPDLAGIAGLPALETLHLGHCRELTTLSGIETCPRLTTLDVDGCDRIVDLARIERLTNLRRLYLCVKPYAGDVPSLAGLTALETLSVSPRACVPGSLVDIGALSALRELSLDGWDTLADLHPLRALDALVELRLTDCSAVTSLDGLEALPALAELVVESCRALADTAALTRRAALAYLEVEGCPLVPEVPRSRRWR